MDGDTEKGCQKPAVQQKTTDNDDDDYRLGQVPPKASEGECLQTAVAGFFTGGMPYFLPNE